MTIQESQAERDLVNFIRNDADLDDLARLYSMLLADGKVVVSGSHGKSDPHIDGELFSEHRTRQ